MKLSATEPGLVLSSSAHAALLVAALVGFWSPKPFEDVSEAIPVELISEAQLRQITQGLSDARKVEPKPAPPAVRTAAVAPEAKPELPPAKPEVAAPPPPPRPPEPKPEPPVEAKVEPPPPPPRPVEPPPEPPARPPPRAAAAPEPKPAEPPSPAVARQPEPPKDAEVVKTAPPKPPEVTKPDPKPKPVEKPKAVAKPTPKPVEDDEPEEKPKPVAKPAPKPKPDEIARLLEPTAAKPAPATPAPAPAKPAPAAQPAKAFDRSDIEKLLRGSGQPPGGTPGPAAQQPQRAASLGAPAGRADKLTPSDRDALIGIVSEQLRRCWSLPPGTSPAYKPALAFAVTEDGVVTGAPTVTNPRSEAAFQSTAASAVRAVQRCSRLNIPARFKPFHKDWARMVITFDPSDVF